MVGVAVAQIHAAAIVVAHVVGDFTLGNDRGIAHMYAAALHIAEVVPYGTADNVGVTGIEAATEALLVAGGSVIFDETVAHFGIVAVEAAAVFGCPVVGDGAVGDDDGVPVAAVAADAAGTLGLAVRDDAV